MARKSDKHPADIIAMLHKKRITLAALSRQAGLSSSTLANVLIRPWPKGEFLLAGALGIHPSEIWPSRYFDSAGNPIDRQKQIRRKLE
ncbi:helix-turn-helix transcriptional regulator [Candidatus Symbiopectobacterium sp. NZEC151]|uniref:helix-turn-helix domain-containing protein n=1 Tax=Candidatus Symbiopectobacterium sp. NZEC151 TaxID=2820470 RepID=UPI002225F30A|nr:helix-turn-helix transcriptional regulator [Candidatus Symbiopectobacterium sp. NZEC151]MCW2474466.1 helix-turn-helix domain-containing protein [Candidatus Symbiopectobacterium sp. NZEC151]